MILVIALVSTIVPRGNSFFGYAPRTSITRFVLTVQYKYLWPLLSHVQRYIHWPNVILWTILGLLLAKGTVVPLGRIR